MQHPLAESVSPKPHVAPVQAARAAAPSGLPVDALDYHLPAECIATHPAQPRDSARMLVVWRSDAARLEHRHVRDLPEYLRAVDALVFNNTAVVPARLEMRRATGGRVEGLFLESPTPRLTAETPEWTVMLHSGGRLKLGDRLTLLDRDDQPTNVTVRIVSHDGEHWVIAVECQGGCDPHAFDVLRRVGRTPLPPYIRKARLEHHESYADQEDRQWYQTVYADGGKDRSVAAPTAGLHFTPELLQRIASMNVQRIDITLHVGVGTFKPVSAATIDQHVMHGEDFEVSAGAIESINRTRRSHGRVLAVGTTSVRTLESLPAQALAGQDDGHGEMCDGVCGSTDILIAPPHQFRHVDGLLTNFHLPRSTLLALVAAMIGLDRVHAVYCEAIARGYRFYSYGDAMLILP